MHNLEKKANSGFSCIGKTTPIHDGLGKVTGELTYVGDFKLPNMLYAKVLFSPIPHGIIKKIDTAEAEVMPGVVKVFTAFNSPETLYCRSRVMASEKSICQEQLFAKQVRFVGDRVAMVVAETLQAAETALPLIDVEYEELPAVFDAASAKAPHAPKLFEQGNVYEGADLDIGRAEEIINGGGTDLLKTHTKYKIPRLHHGMLENHCCVAAYSKYNGKLTIYSPCQSVFGVRVGVAEILGLPYHKVRVVKTTMGGSFGVKQETVLEPLAALAALHTGRPVRLEYNRQQVISSVFLRAAMEFSMTSYMTANGDLQCFDIDCEIDAGAYLTNSLDYAWAMLGKLSRSYDVPNLRFRGSAVCTNTPVSGSYRSWGALEINGLVEHNLAAAAKQHHLDEVELRLKNLQKPYGTNYVSGINVGNCGLAQCLHEGSEAFGWRQKLQTCETENRTQERYRYGIGLAVASHVNGFYPEMQEFAEVGMRINEDGTIQLNACIHDNGCGSVTLIAKIVAETLGLPEEDISLLEADTAYNFYDYGCYGSRTVYVIGSTVKKCAQVMIVKLKTLAAELWEIQPEEVFYANGKLTAKNPARQIMLTELAQLCQTNQQVDLQVSINQKMTTNPVSGGVHFAQVRVDTYTGRTEVIAYLAAHDIGKALNPEICRAQIGGAVQQGLGGALLEEVLINPISGHVMNSNFSKYHLANISEIPDVQVLFVENGGDEGPFGAKSLGEVAIAPVSAAILNAVNHALTLNMSQMPATPEYILACLNEGGARKND
jgi:xanthine dehydrogenase molybdenum-binding subunit